MSDPSEPRTPADGATAEPELASHDPAELRRILLGLLPGQAHVIVTPRDRDGRRCASWRAHHYELQAYYTTNSLASLDVLETAMAALPGVYRTTRKSDGDGLDDLHWPTKRRDTQRLRPQVLGLMFCGRDTP